MNSTTLSQADPLTQPQKKPPKRITRVLQRLRIRKPTSMDSLVSGSCIFDPLSDMGRKSDASPPDSLFEFYGVARNSTWGEIITKCYQGTSDESPLQGTYIKPQCSAAMLTLPSTAASWTIANSNAPRGQVAYFSSRSYNRAPSAGKRSDASLVQKGYIGRNCVPQRIPRRRVVLARIQVFSRR